MNFFTIFGLVLDFFGTLYLLRVLYNPSELDRAKWIKWLPKKNDSLNFSVRRSTLDKKVAFGLFLLCLGFLLQIIGIFC